MNKILVFGDSHSHYYDITKVPSNHILRTKSILGYYVERSGFDGASVKGFGRRKKSTLNLTDEILHKINTDDITVLAFGQVDIELGYYYRKFVKDSDQSFLEFMKDCIESYKTLVLSVKKNSKHVIIKGINMPIMIDQIRAIQYTKRIITENLTSPIGIQTASKKLQQGLPGIFKRISMAEEFNQNLQRMCIEYKLEYFDVNEAICYSNGIVKEEFITSIADIHLIPSLKTRQIHFNTLRESIKKSLSKENMLI